MVNKALNIDIADVSTYVTQVILRFASVTNGSEMVMGEFRSTCIHSFCRITAIGITDCTSINLVPRPQCISFDRRFGGSSAVSELLYTNLTEGAMI